ncbi:DinB family protein [Peribacillus sp. SCS-37]|uniref:DinB family protein n=1 Tax=Paraperibacillus esterisolvens TaxID=3115296 RepID=UPI003906C06F
MIHYTLGTKSPLNGRIGELFWMLEHVRETTLQELTDLQPEELDYTIESGGNSIGALLFHIAAIEKVHQHISFEGRDMNEGELKRWRHGLYLSDKTREEVKNNPLSYYTELLREVREGTLAGFSMRDDAWLYEEKAWSNGIPYNHYYLWFHVLEDEISHRGQIRMLIRMLRSNGRSAAVCGIEID